MRVVQDTQIIELGRIRRPYLAGLDLEFGLAQTSSFDENLICDAPRVSMRRLS